MTTKDVSVWILGDQLVDAHPALRHAEDLAGRQNVRVVMVESDSRIRRHPYQRKKLVLLLSAMRHYAAELRAQGYEVDYRQAPSMQAGLQEHCRSVETATLVTMAAADHGGRRWQHERLADALGLPVTVVPNTQFLIGRFDPFPESQPGRRYVMEHFYRAMRRRFGLLLDDTGGPEGGRWNLDAENRKPLPKAARPPAPRSFAPDAITLQVMAEVEAAGWGVGAVDGFDLAVTRAQAEAAADDFLARRLPDFGAYEDAMSSASASVYHSLLSPYLNLGLLEPLALARQAEAAYRKGRAPLNSVEGFIRQVVGWREYIAWQYHRLMPDLAAANAWNAHRPLPGWFWDGDTAMNCLRTVIKRALDGGYTHHIERLMVLCNFALLAGLDPAAVNEWFLTAYVDAYEWVVTPNVLGMGLNADGGLIATKPYLASGSYIDRMSDYCDGCRFQPKQRLGPEACPFTTLYWNFLIAHEAELRSHPRFGPAVLGLSRLAPAEREAIRAEAAGMLSLMSC